jgi:hypothetical protein
MEAEEIAREFHDAYERLAPDFNYETREESAKPWEEVPESNQGLMVAVVKELMDREIIMTPPPQKESLF